MPVIADMADVKCSYNISVNLQTLSTNSTVVDGAFLRYFHMCKSMNCLLLAVRRRLSSFLWSCCQWVSLTCKRLAPSLNFTALCLKYPFKNSDSASESDCSHWFATLPLTSQDNILGKSQESSHILVITRLTSCPTGGNSGQSEH